MKFRNPIAFAVLAAALAVPALHAQPAATAASASAADYSDAEVRKVDKENQKVTLRHGEIKNLGMPAMTMVFGVKDAALLDKIKAGDKVRFHAANDAGKLVVTEIVPAK